MATNWGYQRTRRINLFGTNFWTTAGTVQPALGVKVVGGEIQGKFLQPATKGISFNHRVWNKDGQVASVNYAFTIRTENYNATVNEAGQIVPFNPAFPYGGRIFVTPGSGTSGSTFSATQSSFYNYVASTPDLYWDGTILTPMPESRCAPLKADIERRGILWGTITGGWTGGNTDDGWTLSMEGTSSSVVQTYMPPAGFADSNLHSVCSESVLDENGDPTGELKSIFQIPPEEPITGFSLLIVYVKAPSGSNQFVSLGPANVNGDGTSRRPDGSGEDGENEEDNPPSGLGPSNIGGIPVLPGIDTVVPSTEATIVLEVDPEPIAFEDTTIGQYRTKSFVIRNKGTSPVSLTEIRSFIPSSPFGFVCDLSTPIPGGGSRSGTAYFVPTNEQEYDEFVVLYNAVGPVYEFQLTGDGVTTGGDPGEEEAIKSISLVGDTTGSGDINFLEQTIDTTTIAPLNIVNTGNVPVILNSSSLGGSSTFTTPGVVEGFNLQPGQSLPINISFTPIAEQEYTGTLAIVSNATSSPQTEIFDPATGTITANFQGKGVLAPVITRIMSFNVENGGTLPDALAGGSGTSKITATISSTGNSSVKITSFQVESPFSLNLENYGDSVPGILGFVNLSDALIIAPGTTSLPFEISFTPPTATNYADDVAVLSNKTFGPNSFQVRGLGTYTEPEGPSGPIEPEEPGEEPGPEFDPGTEPSTGLDGIGSACIEKECGVTYVYEYSANGKVLT